MEAEPPVVTLVNAILLSAEKKRASALRIRRDGVQSVVEFLIDGVTHVEMHPGIVLHPMIVRRLAVMASLPTYGKGQSATGYIHVKVGEVRDLYFAILVEGHGDEAEAHLRVITAAEMPTGG